MSTVEIPTRPPGAPAPVLDDVGIFLTAGRVKDPSVALTEGEDAERLGIATAWLSERYDLKDAGALLGGVAARTTRLRVGTGVIATGSRHPLITASLASTMQAMYGGRFILGLGRSGAEYLRGQSIPEHGLQAFEDYVGIVRRLLRGETVSYDGPAGRYEALRCVDPLRVEPPPIWSVILGGPKASRLAARIADGVMLQPFITPEATRRAVGWIREERARVGLDPAIRICGPLVTACELDDHQTLAITKGRMVTYIQMRTFAGGYVRINGWDAGPMKAVQDHPQFAALDRANADQVFTATSCSSRRNWCPTSGWRRRRRSVRSGTASTRSRSTWTPGPTRWPSTAARRRRTRPCWPGGGRTARRAIRRDGSPRAVTVRNRRG